MKTARLSAPIVVVGGGSSGFAAALTAARAGVEVILVERDSMLGGTAVNAGVNCWEPTVDGDGLPRELYERMRQFPDGAGIYQISRHRHFLSGAAGRYPGGEQRLAPNLAYDDTLNGGRPPAGRFAAGVIFEPEAWSRSAAAMLHETGRCRVLTGRRAVRAIPAGRRLVALELQDGAQLAATVWIDSCGIAAAGAGARIFRGEDPRGRFGEPDAPEIPSGRSNGVSLLFRIAPAATPAIEPLPPDCRRPDDDDDAPPGEWPDMVATEYPNGDFNCNMLPTMTGEEFLRLGGERAYEVCRRRVLRYWHHLQTAWPEFRCFRLKSLFPRLGVREDIRVECDYMLTENDLLAGRLPPDTVTRADHPMDRHGMENGGRRLQAPYGIPYRSLLPRGLDNLLVTGRIAGFSSLAASSCRLSRTMMQLGVAAGAAAAAAIAQSCPLRQVNLKYKESSTWTVEKKPSSSPAAPKATATASPER